jgi:hypothetical protein
MTKRILISFMILVHGSSLVVAAEDVPWTWAGIEILGNHKVPRSEIEKLIPIPIGGDYHRGDAPFWTEACVEVRRTFDFAAVECGDRPLRVFDGRKAYLIVDIVEKGRESVLKFRDAPVGSVPFGNDEMVSISAELASKTMKAAMAGHYYNEISEKGHLTYVDPTANNEDLGPQIARLAELVPQNRDNVFDVLRHEKDPKNRQTAATLLNWIGGDLEETLRVSQSFLDDPDDGVRNNVSRFMIQFVGNVKSKRVRHHLIDAFVGQIERPSHGDRNKGLYNLLAIAKASPADRGYMRRHAGEPIRYLAQNSVVFNVQGPARELLALIDPIVQNADVGSR